MSNESDCQFELRMAADGLMAPNRGIVTRKEKKRKTSANF